MTNEQDAQDLSGYPEKGEYDVALWRYWPPRELPIVADHVAARSPEAAIIRVMRLHNLRACDHVAAHLHGGSYTQTYRAYGLELSRKAQTDESEVRS